jgi:DNA-binding CsgD family transcriptional regulator
MTSKSVTLESLSADRRTDSDRHARARFHLTPREVEVLTHVLRGRANKQIAASLGITEQAVKEHVSGLLGKFEVPNRAALAEAGTRLEFAGEPGVDRSWMRELFLVAEPLIVIARGPDIRYEAGNRAFAEATGKRPFVGRTMRETFPELEGQGVFESTERVFATGSPVIEHEVERRWDRGNGIETRLMDIVIQPLHDEHGTVNGIAAFSFDVTELVGQRQRAELLREELAALLDLVTNGVIIVDHESRILKINETGRRILRQQPDHGSALDERMAAVFDLRDTVGHAVEPSDTSVARALRGGEIPTRELRFVAGDPPERVTVRISVRALRDPDGSVGGAVLVLTELGAEPV